MNTKAILTGFILILVSFAIFFYKLFALNIPFLPYKAQNQWRYEIKINKSAYNLLENQLPDVIYLPIPPILESQSLTNLKIENQKYGEIQESANGKLFAVSRENLLEHKKFKVEATIIIHNTRSKVKPAPISPKEKKKYLDLKWLAPDELELIKELNKSIINKEDNKQEIFDKIAYFILDEFIIKPEISDFKEVIQLKNGDSLSQAKMFLALCRINKIPARISFGTTVLDAENDKKVKHMRLFINEYYLNGKWSYFHPDFPNVGSMPQNFLLIHRDITPEMELLNSRDFYSTSVKPIRKNFFDSKEYFDTVIKQHSDYSIFSLYRLPLGTQSLFFTLLLIPLGTLILSIARNIIGIITFGVFTPILLTLFFLETSFIPSFLFILSVILVGIVLHVLLNKLYLLAVPRLSIMLTVVIIMYLCFAMITSQTEGIGNNKYTLNYFPIVIVSVFLERFMIQLREEGLRNAITTTAGTILVAFICYTIFSINVVSVVFFNHPEFLLTTIGLNIFIGSYTGFRLTELIRFKELLTKK
ncbi:MAG: hypothetical protein KDD40_06675 [Bdellovibrionales bacterium]|nr:hypothetical protein [Bdellovibrionales bacterium]